MRKHKLAPSFTAWLGISFNPPLSKEFNMYSRLLLVFALASGTALAQATSLPAQQESVQSLIDRIQQLEKRISELEDHQRKQDAAATANLQTVTEGQESQDNATSAPALHSEHAASSTAIREAEMHYPSL